MTNTESKATYSTALIKIDHTTQTSVYMDIDTFAHTYDGKPSTMPRHTAFDAVCAALDTECLSTSQCNDMLDRGRLEVNGYIVTLMAVGLNGAQSRHEAITDNTGTRPSFIKRMIARLLS